MVTWHLVVTKSARGSMWFMHRCFRLRGMNSSSWACVEQAGLLDRAQVSRHCRSCKQYGPTLCMQQKHCCQHNCNPRSLCAKKRRIRV